MLADRSRVVEIEGVGAFEVNRLGMADKLNIVALLDTVPKNDQNEIASQRDALAFGIELLQVALTGFNTEAGRQALNEMHPANLQPLIDVAMEVNNLYEADAAADGGAAKND